MDIEKDRIFSAIGFCLAAHLMLALMSAGVKFLASDYSVIEIAFVRNLIVFVPLALFIVLTKKFYFLKTNKPKTIFLRSFISSIGVIVTFAALAKLPLSYATVLFFTSSLITPALAFFFLKEHVGIHRWSAVFIGMCGVIVIAQPSGAVSMIGVGLALLAALGHGAMFTILRHLKTESPITIAFYLFLGGLIVPGLFMPWVSKGITFEHFPYMIAIAALAAIAQLLMTLAYKYAPASFITPFSYTALLWNMLIDVYIWHYDLEYRSIFIGAGLILSAQLYIIYRETKHKKSARIPRTPLGL